MGRLLTAIGQRPSLIVTSPAVRATATAELTTDAGAWSCPIVVDDALYGAGPERALDVIEARAAGAAGPVLVIGHEPSWSLLVRRLTGAAVAMKTATVAGIDLREEPPPNHGGILVYLLQPRLFDRLDGLGGDPG